LAELVVPKIVADMGDQAARRFIEFFVATIGTEGRWKTRRPWRTMNARAQRNSMTARVT
jgi:hypothetical protein